MRQEVIDHTGIAKADQRATDAERREKGRHGAEPAPAVEFENKKRNDGGHEKEEEDFDARKLFTEADGERFFIHPLIGGAVAEIVQRNQDDGIATRHDAQQNGIRGIAQCLDEIGSRRGYEPEEEKSENLTESEVGQREWSGGIKNSEKDRGHTDPHHRPARAERQKNPRRGGEEEKENHPEKNRAGFEQARGGDAHRAEAVSGVGTFFGVPVVIREIRGDLDANRPEQGGERGGEVSLRLRECQGAAEEDRREGGEQGFWATGEHPGFER